MRTPYRNRCCYQESACTLWVSVVPSHCDSLVLAIRGERGEGEGEGSMIITITCPHVYGVHQQLLSNYILVFTNGICAQHTRRRKEWSVGS